MLRDGREMQSTKNPDPAVSSPQPTFSHQASRTMHSSHYAATKRTQPMPTQQSCTPQSETKPATTSTHSRPRFSETSKRQHTTKHLPAPQRQHIVHKTAQAVSQTHTGYKTATDTPRSSGRNPPRELQSQSSNPRAAICCEPICVRSCTRPRWTCM